MGAQARGRELSRSPELRVAIVRPAEAGARRYDACIVIDVLRATTTAAVLCRRLGDLCVARTPADLAALPVLHAGYALFSELAGVESDVPRFDNSPVQAGRVELGGRRPVLVTTNGTRAVAIAAGIADHVVLGAFVNLGAVLAHLAARDLSTIAVMPAGNVKKAEGRAEDDGCAEAFAARLAGAPLDLDAVIARCRADGRVVERRATEHDLGPDIDLAFDVDAVPVVPVVRGDAARGWFDVAPAA